jgi:hypothetical protein
MLPTLTPKDAPDGVAGNPEVSTYPGTGFPNSGPPMDVTNVRSYQPSSVDTLPLCMSVFADGVKPVIVVCSEKEMAWPNATRVIASMKYTQTFGNRADKPFISHSMGTVSPTSLPSRVEHAISTGSYASDPNPTASGFGNLRPEAFFGATMRTHRKITPFGAMQRGGHSRRRCTYYNTV